MSWPEHIGVGGLCASAVSASRCQLLGDAALDAIGEWVAGGSTKSVSSFPFDAVLGHYRAVGRYFVAAPVVGALAEARAAGTWRKDNPWFDQWLASATDQASGDYAGYAFVPALTDFMTGAEVGSRTVAADALTVAALLDLLSVELDALAVESSAAQRRRTRATALALCRADELAPNAPLVSSARLAANLHPDCEALDAAFRDSLAEPESPAVRDARKLLSLSMMPVTIMHDEQMFIRSIQLFEIQFELCRLALENVAVCLEKRDGCRAVTQLHAATKRLRAVRVYSRILATMPPSSFSVIRKYTHGRSAIQSRTYRDVEVVAARTAWLRYTEFRPEADSRVCAAVADGLDNFDRSWQAMKKTHWGITLKTIGRVPGTGGTEGADYLRARAACSLFPEPL
jgi:tryptophan 2,3-dioxygenase